MIARWRAAVKFGAPDCGTEGLCDLALSQRLRRLSRICKCARPLRFLWMEDHVTVSNRSLWRLVEALFLLLGPGESKLILMVSLSLLHTY